jgi:hypothetical protein
MTPPFPLEINRTVAALAAETRSSPTVAHKSCVERKPPPTLRPQPLYARSVCFIGVQGVDDAHERGGVLAPRRVTGTKSRRMVWLEIWNGKARVMVDEALHKDWKEGYPRQKFKRRQHVLRRVVSLSR